MPQPTAPAAAIISTRALSHGPSSVVVEARTIEAILTSEHPVRTWIPAPTGDDYIEVDEVLLTSGVDLSRARGMPLLDSHCSFGTQHHLGQVDSIRAEVVAGLGDCIVISARVKPSRAEIISEMADGFYPNLSAGYVVHEYELVARAGDVPLARAVRWTLLEASLVPIGADPNASVRSGGRPASPPTVRMLADPATPPSQDITVDLEAQIAAAEAALTAADNAIAAITAEIPTGTDAAITARAAAVRLRALGAAVEPKTDGADAEAKAKTDVEKAEADEKAAKAKADADAEKAKAKTETDDEKSERTAFAAIRSVAQSWGAEVLRLADDLAALGTRSAEIRTAVRAEVLKRGASTPAPEVKPAPKAATTELLDTRALYAALNKPR